MWICSESPWRRHNLFWRLTQKCVKENALFSSPNREPMPSLFFFIASFESFFFVRRSSSEWFHLTTWHSVVLVLWKSSSGPRVLKDSCSLERASRRIAVPCFKIESALQARRAQSKIRVSTLSSRVLNDVSTGLRLGLYILIASLQFKTNDFSRNILKVEVEDFLIERLE